MGIFQKAKGKVQSTMGKVQSRYQEYKNDKNKNSPYAYDSDEPGYEPDEYYNEDVREKLSSQKMNVIELNDTSRPSSSRASSMSGKSDSDLLFESAENGGGGGGGNSSRPTSKLTRKSSESTKANVITRVSPARKARRRRASITGSGGIANGVKPKAGGKTTRKRRASVDGSSSSSSSSSSSGGDKTTQQENAKAKGNIFAQAAKSSQPVKLTANAKAKNRLTFVQKRAQELAHQPIHMPAVSDTAARTGDTRFKSVRGMIALNPDFPIFRAAPPGTYEDHHPDVEEPDENAYGEAGRPVESTREEVSARIKRIAMGTAAGGGYNPGMATVAFGPQIIQGFKEKRQQKKKLDRMNESSGGAKVKPRKSTGKKKLNKRWPPVQTNAGFGAPKTKHMGKGDIMSLL